MKAIIGKAALATSIFCLLQTGNAWSQPSLEGGTLGQNMVKPNHYLLMAQESGSADSSSNVDTSSWQVINGNGFKVRFPNQTRYNRTNYSGAFAETWETETD